MSIMIDSDGNSGRSNKSSDDEKLSVQCGISEKESKCKVVIIFLNHQCLFATCRD